MYQKLNPKVDLDNQSVVLEDGSRISRLSVENLESFYENVTTTFEGFKRGIDVSDNGPCLGKRSGDTFHWLSYQEVYDRAQAFGSGLIADGLEAKNDTHIGIYSMNRRKWTITDIACTMFSMVGIPLYDTLGSDAVRYIINEVELSHIVCDTNGKAQQLLVDGERFPSLRCIIVMDPVEEATLNLAGKTSVKVKHFTDVEKSGKSKLKEPVLPKADHLMTICYTSGTTGNPKGVMITHRNMIMNIFSLMLWIQDATSINPRDRYLSYLPLAHQIERLVQTVMLMHGCQIGFYSGDIKKLLDDLQCLKPHHFATVPRLLNRIYDKVLSASSSSRLKSLIFNIAMSQKAKDIESGIVRNNSWWDYLVFGKIQQQLGGCVKLIITGSAPLEAKVLDFCRRAFGCLVLEGYGQTEATTAITGTIPGDSMAGHVGCPLPGCKVKVVDVPEMGYFAKDGKGEICCSGPTVCLGYYKNNEMTNSTIDDDGWLHTGDIGVWLPNGTLKIIDRKKNIFKLAQGEYIAPEKVEIAYMRSRYVAQVFVEGNSFKACLMAVVVPDEETVVDLCKDVQEAKNMELVCKNEEIKNRILKDMVAVGRELGLKSFEQVRDIHLSPEPFSVENNLLTSTFKNKRVQLRQFYEQVIEHLYEKHSL